MYKRFAFEGEVHQSLSCVPLTVRRKLDLAGLKISLDGWQHLPREERMALCHLPVDDPDDLASYQEIMRGFCDRHGVPLKPLAGVEEAQRSWNGPDVPDIVIARVAELGPGLTLAPAAWRALDEESRYALLKLSDPKQAIVKLRAALVELGLAPESVPAGDPAACDRMPGETPG